MRTTVPLVEGGPRQEGCKYEHKFPTLTHGYPWLLVPCNRFSGALGLAGALRAIDSDIDLGGVEGGSPA